MDYISEAGSRSWRKKVLIPTGILNFSPQDNNGDGDATDPGDFADPSLRTFGPEWAEDVKTLAVSAGWPVYTLYERKGYYHDGSAYSLTRCNADSYVQNVIHEWKNNNYGFVTWLGHGTATEALRLCWTDDSSWPGVCNNLTETTWYNIITSSDCSALDDSHPAIVAQVSCCNAYPENSGNLAYSLLKNGAVATFAATRESWYVSGEWSTTHAVAYGDNVSYGYYLFDTMAVQGYNTSYALNYCRTHFGIDTWGSAAWMNMLDFNLHGDPSISMFYSSSVTPTPPEAYGSLEYTQLNTPITIDLQASDDGLPNPPGSLSYIITNNLPSCGTLTDPGASVISSIPYTLANNGNQVVYTPDLGNTNPDSFRFKVNDGDSDSSEPTILIYIDTCFQTPTFGGAMYGWTYPFHTAYTRDCRTQVIYPMMDYTGIITDLALYVLSGPPIVLNDWTIRLKTTSMSSWPGGVLPWFDAAGWTIVYRADEQPTGGGWYNFHLSTPYYYDGMGYLMVDFSFNNDSSAINSGYVRYTQPGTAPSIIGASSSHGDPLTWTGSDGPGASKDINYPNMKLGITVCEQPGDTDGDLQVNLNDMVLLDMHWQESGCPIGCGPTDLDGNGEVTLGDLIMLSQHWLEGAAP